MLWNSSNSCILVLIADFLRTDELRNMGLMPMDAQSLPTSVSSRVNQSNRGAKERELAEAVANIEQVPYDIFFILVY